VIAKHLDGVGTEADGYSFDPQAKTDKKYSFIHL
jgi:hypothetical protein